MKLKDITEFRNLDDHDRYRDKIARLCHRNFVDLMYPQFGHNTHPGYAKKIIFRPMLIDAGVGFNNIYIKYDIDNNLIPFLIYHESAHTFDYFLKSEIKKYSKEIPNRNRFLVEVIAELGAFTYVWLSEGERSKGELEEILFLNKKIYNTTQFALELFEGDKDILSKIVNKDMREVKKIIPTKISRKLDLRKRDPY